LYFLFKLLKKYLHKTINEGERVYMESRIPLKEYLSKKEIFNFSLPEIIFHESIPVDKIHISNEQPFLEEELKISKGDDRERFMHRIEKVPELSDWLDDFKKRVVEGEFKAGEKLA
jgi:hypothetical protein